MVGQGLSVTLGEDFNLFYGISEAGGTGSQTYVYTLPAGSYSSVSIIGGSTSPAVFDSLTARILHTKTSITSGDVLNLSQEDVYGDVFYGSGLAYFTEYLAMAHLASQVQNGRHNLPIAYGNFGYEPNVQTFFGFPRAIDSGGFVVNVRLSRVIGSLSASSAARRALNVQTGLISSVLEHRVPEQMFSDPQQPTQGVSAVKALRISAQQGQRIYHVTQANVSTTLPNLHLDTVALSEISQAVAAGKEAIAHTDRISVDGWTGEGYILFDPITGDGAYKITGGKNGGFFGGIKYVISVAELFYDALEALASSLGSKVPLLGTIVAFLKLAKFFHSVLEKGLRCSNLTAVIIAFTIMTIGALLITELFIELGNPLVGFFVGFGIDQAIDFLFDEAQDCA